MWIKKWGQDRRCIQNLWRGRVAFVMGDISKDGFESMKVHNGSGGHVVRLGIEKGLEGFGQQWFHPLAPSGPIKREAMAFFNSLFLISTAGEITIQTLKRQQMDSQSSLQCEEEHQCSSWMNFMCWPDALKGEQCRCPCSCGKTCQWKKPSTANLVTWWEAHQRSRPSYLEKRLKFPRASVCCCACIYLWIQEEGCREESAWDWGRRHCMLDESRRVFFWAHGFDLKATTLRKA